MGTIVRVLVVDDSPPFKHMAKDHLENLACAVTTASSGEEALQTLQRRSFDLMVTDFRMPGISGVRLAEITKENYPDMKVIMMSTNRAAEGHPALDGFVHKTEAPGLEVGLEQLLRELVKK